MKRLFLFLAFALSISCFSQTDDYYTPRQTAEINNQKGIAEFRNGNYDLALYDFNLALQDSFYAEAYICRGNLLLSNSDTRQAFADFDRAILLDNSSCEAYCGRAVAKICMGDKEGGRKDYRIARRLCPGQARYWFREKQNIHANYTVWAKSREGDWDDARNPYAGNYEADNDAKAEAIVYGVILTARILGVIGALAHIR